MVGPKDSLFELSLEECHEHFTQPQEGVEVVRPCTLGDGIEQWTAEEVEHWSQTWDDQLAERCGLWVPASGAATRMFQFLRTDEEAQQTLWAAADRLALGQRWKKAVQARLGAVASAQAACEVLWTEMSHGRMPKGLVPFHGTGGNTENAFDAHLSLWRMLFPHKAQVWFTVPPDKQQEIDAHLAATAPEMAWNLPHQQHTTDLPVWTAEGTWLTDESGELVRRPGGHGALLPLLQEVSVPFVVIRNIDNAPSPSRRELRAMWTRAMLSASHAWSQERDRMRESLKGSEDLPQPVFDWLQTAGAGLQTSAKPSVDEARSWLDRPMRLVGVVRNEGQPGGGPYWVHLQSGPDAGLIRPQIVESIEFADTNKSIMQEATHFNPVDMVCVLDPGQSLSPYVDSSRYMLATKDVEGRPATVLEHPGLWNGSMSGWLTRFVELPSDCFQPVKSALDLIDRK